MSEKLADWNTGLARAKAQQVIDIIENNELVQTDPGAFDIFDARWSIKLLAEAIVALLPEEPS